MWKKPVGEEQRMLTLRLPVAVLGVMTALALAGGVAYATIPDSNGVIQGCYGKSGGSLRVIDSAVAECKSNETPLAWNVQGPPGEQGDPGAPATALWAVLRSDGTVIASSGVDPNPNFTGRLGTGSYQVLFTRNIASCAATASVFQDVGVVVPRFAMVSRTSQSQVGVLVFEDDGTFTDSSIHLAVFC